MKGGALAPPLAAAAARPPAPPGLRSLPPGPGGGGSSAVRWPASLPPRAGFASCSSLPSVVGRPLGGASLFESPRRGVWGRSGGPRAAPWPPPALGCALAGGSPPPARLGPVVRVPPGRGAASLVSLGGAGGSRSGLLPPLAAPPRSACVPAPPAALALPWAAAPPCSSRGRT